MESREEPEQDFKIQFSAHLDNTIVTTARQRPTNLEVMERILAAATGAPIVVVDLK